MNRIMMCDYLKYTCMSTIVFIDCESRDDFFREPLCPASPDTLSDPE